MVKLGSYVLRLWCDTEGCGMVERHGIQHFFSGQTESACNKQAKKLGWHVGYRNQYCPVCTGKMVFSSDLVLQPLSYDEMKKLPEGQFGEKR